MSRRSMEARPLVLAFGDLNHTEKIQARPWLRGFTANYCMSLWHPRLKGPQRASGWQSDCRLYRRNWVYNLCGHHSGTDIITITTVTSWDCGDQVMIKGETYLDHVGNGFGNILPASNQLEVSAASITSTIHPIVAFHWRVCDVCGWCVCKKGITVTWSRSSSRDEGGGHRCKRKPLRLPVMMIIALLILLVSVHFWLSSIQEWSSVVANVTKVSFLWITEQKKQHFAS